ncbi:protein phosphatase 2C domain-containing protein [Seohaeicola saemankumensis]|nr:protein phosphatase 2C domain-containing protein [Seohaeicola saemankumensis]MCA0869796.1 protein phosphatase 2C domain-containing protein [Seohaeicola saemankumensis]
MHPSAEFHYDAASALSQGQRETQEDAIAADFPVGAGVGFAVLADGMGGHAAGDIASGIVVTEVFSELKLRAADPDFLERNIAQVLHDAAFDANDCVGHHVASHPRSHGMGATLVAPVFLGNRLYWISVGDSPLFLFRDGRLRRLNADHSLTPQIDYLASRGLMATEEALNHPDRNCLTSVLFGHEIALIDCPAEPVSLQANDIVVAASDGLLFLEEEEIEGIIQSYADRTSSEISSRLLAALANLDDPDQDNVSLCVIKVNRSGIEAAEDGQMSSATLPRPVPMPRARDSLTVMVNGSKTRQMLMYRAKAGRSA